MPKINKRTASYPLKMERVRLGLRLRDVCEDVPVGPGTLSRIETAVTTPSRETARELYDYFEGRVPMAAIYDPQWYQDIYLPTQAKVKGVSDD